MSSILWHDRTKIQIEAFIASPSHALLLSGPQGNGKDTVAQYVIRSCIAANSPYVYFIEPETQVISIEQIRSIEALLRLRVPNNDPINRVVCIKKAHVMTHEAQNALLKNIEEPPIGTLFILCSDDDSQLLATIQSRVTTIHVLVPEATKTSTYFKSMGFSDDAITRASLQSGGLPGVMYSLLHDEDHPLLQATKSAKTLLSSDRYQKLLLVDTLAKDKQETKNVIDVLQRIASMQIGQSKGEQMQKWAKIYTLAYQASDMLHANAQPKLVLDFISVSV